eukprot:3039410-Prymnesium_polylepis.1
MTSAAAWAWAAAARARVRAWSKYSSRLWPPPPSPFCAGKRGYSGLVGAARGGTATLGPLQLAGLDMCCTVSYTHLRAHETLMNL